MRPAPRRRPAARVRSALEAVVLRRFVLAVVFGFVFAFVALSAARPAAGASRDRRFFSARQGVGIEAPAGWALSLHTGYPEILCVLVHPDGSRLSLSAAPTKVPDAKALAEQSRRGLEAQHLAIARVADGPRGGVLVEARGAGKDTELRQLYIVRPAGAGKLQAVVLTLSTRAATIAAAGAAFDWAVAHLVLEAPADATETAPAHPHAPDGGAAAK
jgi:hypothetical protein